VIRSDHLGSLEHGDAIQVAGLVVARQRPETARGFTFVLLEDESGMMNAIVRPQVYDRDRTAIRGEPFLWILGTLAKDDGTLNIVAEEVRALKITRTIGQSDLRSERAKSPYAFLKRLRRDAPHAKSWS